MSKNIYFYIRHNDEFLPILSIDRSNALYQVFANYVPYGQISAINDATLRSVEKELNEKISNYKKIIEKYRNENNTIVSFNNSIEEKLEAMRTNSLAIDELQDEIDELYTTLHYVYFMSMMLEEYYNQDYFYAGIEICSPTLDDVAE